MSDRPISAAAVARLIRDYDVSFRLGWDDAEAWVRRKEYPDDEQQLAYDLGFDLNRGAGESLKVRMAERVERERIYREMKEMDD